MILVTGANGEMGVALIKDLFRRGHRVVSLDLQPVSSIIASLVEKNYVGDVVDVGLMRTVFDENNISTIYHLAAILSTKAETHPIQAHRVNVDGFLNLIQAVANKKVKVFFPSSIAVYNLEGRKVEKISERDFCQPSNIYGCNKLYCEQLGFYFSRHARGSDLDFRSIRFPGIISSETLPQGGTSDYAPQMVHRAAQGRGYTCFVRPDTQIPFMVMPDAIKAINCLMEADREHLSSHVYHIQAFAPTVEEMLAKLTSKYPEFHLKYDVDPMRQKIVDSWPNDLDQSLATNDWRWKPDYDFDAAFDRYLIPNIERGYFSVSRSQQN